MKGQRLSRAISQVVLIMSVGWLLVPLSSASATSAPPGFHESVIADVPHATALAFLPDGRLLITTQEGEVWIYDDGLSNNPALNLRDAVCSNAERGLLAITVDPEFATNGFVYVFYTFDNGGTCAAKSTPAPVNRVSRFVLQENGVIDPQSEYVLLDNIPSPDIGVHNGADMHFGKDGYLYISVGDGGCDYAEDSGCFAENNAARDMSVMLGKILRVTRNGGIPQDNPFKTNFSASCRLIGYHPEGKTCQEIYAFGLRNPFRMAFDQESPTTRFYIGDVGDNNWEEIDEGAAGADYGWNFREGHCFRNSTTNCGPPPPGVTNPIYDYHHSTGCSGITAGAFVPPGIWPAEYDGVFLYGDYVCGKIFTLNENADGTFSASELFTDMGYSTIGMAFGPYQDGQALYYITYPGEVRRVTYVGEANRSPTAIADASPSYGSAPLTVQLDGSASTDPDGDELEYTWDFGDGSAAASGAVVSHTYQDNQNYTATLTVRDGSGASDQEEVTIWSGNTPPAITIDAPDASQRYQPGDTLMLSARAGDAEDGPMLDGDLTWTATLHHNSHTHPYMAPTRGNHLVLSAPEHYDSSPTAKTFLSIRASAVDSRGLEGAATVEVWPELETAIVSAPTRKSTAKAATFEFTANDPDAEFECSLDGEGFGSCASPMRYSRLTDGRHTFAVRARDERGNFDPEGATYSWAVDATPPPVPDLDVADGARFSLSRRFEVSWSGAGQRFDLDYVHAEPGSRRSEVHQAVRTTSSKSLMFEGVPGRSYCFHVRARDAFGNSSKSSQTKCVSIALDHPVLQPAKDSSWYSKRGPEYYMGSASATKTRGSILRFGELRAGAAGLITTRCPTCGSVTLWALRDNGDGRTFVKTLPFGAAALRHRAISRFRFHRHVFDSGSAIVLEIRSSSTRRVEIDGVAFENRFLRGALEN